MTVVADTSPLNYLIQIEAIRILPAIYGEIAVPSAVLDELRAPGAPESVRAWANRLPLWINEKSPGILPPDHSVLGRGELHAIALASELGAGSVLLDDRAARRVALEKGLIVTGTIGVLERGAEKDLINLHTAFRLLLETNFRIEPRTVADALARLSGKKS
jgi:predicted nucleic acid-binding protein